MNRHLGRFFQQTPNAEQRNHQVGNRGRDADEERVVPVDNVKCFLVTIGVFRDVVKPHGVRADEEHNRHRRHDRTGNLQHGILQLKIFYRLERNCVLEKKIVGGNVLRPMHYTICYVTVYDCFLSGTFFLQEDIVNEF